ncbi:hypothetical protein AB0M68_38315 [Streptomyces sp. NPDC051453]
MLELLLRRGYPVIEDCVLVLGLLAVSEADLAPYALIGILTPYV